MGNLLKRLEPTPALQTFQVSGPLSAASPGPFPQTEPGVEPKQSVAAVEAQRSAQSVEDKLRIWLIDTIIAGLPTHSEMTCNPQTLQTIHDRITGLVAQTGVALSPEDTNQLEHAVTDEILGYGPLEPLLADPSITEIMVNGPDHIYIEQKGRVLKTQVRFNDDAHVLRIIDRIIRPLGRRVLCIGRTSVPPAAEST